MCGEFEMFSLNQPFCCADESEPELGKSRSRAPIASLWKSFEAYTLTYTLPHLR